jgi:hypothetical protein
LYVARANYSIAAEKVKGGLYHSLDANGVALAAIQGLYGLVQEKDARIAELEKQVAALEAPNAASRRRLTIWKPAWRRWSSGSAARPPRQVPCPSYGLALSGLLILGVVAYRQREEVGR